MNIKKSNEIRIIFVQTEGSGNPHLGLMYLAGVLKKDGYMDVYHVSLLSDKQRAEKRNMEYLISLFNRDSIVAVTSMISTLPSSLKICEMAKSYGCSVILGGPAPSILKEKLLEQYPFIDIVCFGEADNTISQIVNNIENNNSLSGINGVIYREANEIISNEPNPYITNLDSLSYPDRDCLNLWSYHTPFSILTSRGCPYNCVYCSKPVHGTNFRARSPKNVVDEIEYLLSRYPAIAKKVQNKISINDDIFNFDIKRAKDICDEIISRDLKLEIICANGFHVKTVDYELFQKMKAAGCKEIWFGVESGNTDVLKRVGKGITTEMVKNAVRLAKKAGIEVIGTHFIIGLPYDDIHKSRDSIKLAKELKVDVANFGYANPLPGTRLYKWVNDNGTMLFSDYIKMKPDIEPLFETPEFTKEEREIVHSEAVKLIDSLYRKKSFKPKSVINFIMGLKSIDDIKWASKKVNAYIFGKNLRIDHSEIKPSIIKGDK